MLHPDLFGSASAQSAALAPKFPNPIPTEGRWGFYARVLQGPFGSPLNESYWEANNPLTLAEHPERLAGLKLYFDCGDHDRYGSKRGRSFWTGYSREGLPSRVFPAPRGARLEYLRQYMKYALLFQWQCFASGEHRSSGGAQR